MGIWHSRQTTSLRGNRFYRRPERSHCLGLSLFRQSSLKQKCAASMRSNALLRQVELKSLTAAAKALKLPKSSIRSKIKNLEERELHDLPDAVVSSFMRDARRVKSNRRRRGLHRWEFRTIEKRGSKIGKTKRGKG